VPQRTIAAPDGTPYRWEKSSAPRPEDYAALDRFRTWAHAGGPVPEGVDPLAWLGRRRDFLRERKQAIDDATRNNFPAPKGDYMAIANEIETLDRWMGRISKSGKGASSKPVGVPSPVRSAEPLKRGPSVGPNRPYDPATAQSWILTPAENRRRAALATPSHDPAPLGSAAAIGARSGAELSRVPPPNSRTPKRPVVEWNGRRWNGDPFDGLSMSREAFQDAIDRDQSVVLLRDGRTMAMEGPSGARELVVRKTGVPSIAYSMPAGQREERQENRLYEGFGKVGVGKTVGFNKGQKDSKVPRGSDAKELYDQNHYRDGVPITDSQRIRDFTNQTVESMTRSMVRLGVPEVVAGFVAGIPTMPLQIGAELKTLSDTTETPHNRQGAALNLIVFAATDAGGRALGEATAPIRARAFAALKATPAFGLVAGAADRAGAVRQAMRGFALPKGKAIQFVDALAQHGPIGWAKAASGAARATPIVDSGLEGLVAAARRAGALSSRSEEVRFRRLVHLRVQEWARETGRPAASFYEGLQVRLDGAMPEGALAQRLQEIPWRLLGDKTTKIGFTIADTVQAGRAKLPSGVELETGGGPLKWVEGLDPQPSEGRAWASTTQSIANRHHGRAADGARLQFTLANSPKNVLASNGLLAIRAELESIATRLPGQAGYVEPERLLAHVRKVVDAYNGLKMARGKPIPRPNSVREFLQSIQQNGDFVDTFVRRGRFSELFWSKTRRGTPTNPLGFDYEQVAQSMVDPAVRRAGKGTSSVLGALDIDPDGAARRIDDLVYPWAVEGRNLGLTAGSRLEDLVPGSFMRSVQESLPAGASEALINATAKTRLLKTGSIEVPTERVLRFLRQEGGDGGTKAWYDATNRTIGLVTGKSDFSSLVHEVFHDWRRSMAEEGIATLEAHFGKRGTVDFEERSARAFERYLRDGQAPSPALRDLFASIRESMLHVYRSIRGTSLEPEVHPEVRATFDRMLGGGPSAERGAAPRPKLWK